MECKKVLAASLWVLGFAGVRAQSTDTITVHFGLNQSVLRQEDRATLDHRFDSSRLIFALAGATAIIIALLTVSAQAMKAARANPVKSLRTD